MAGEVTAYGTNAHGGPARADAEVVRRLRAAGAVVIGKTNVPELTHLAVHRDGDVRRDAQPVGSAARARRLERRQRRGGRRRSRRRGARLRRRGLDPHPGGVVRAVRAEAAARARIARAARQAWHGLSVNGVLTRRVADTALFHDVASEGPARRREGAARMARRRCRRFRSRSLRAHRRLVCGSRSRRACRSAWSRAWTTMRAAPWMRPPSCCARSATRSRSRTPTMGLERSRRCSRATCAGYTTTRASWPTPSVWNGARGDRHASAG